MRKKRGGFSVAEMIIVVAIIATFTVICFWPQKGVYRMSQEVLLEDFVLTLNQNIELYKVCALESSPKANVDFSTKENALEVLRQGISGMDTPLISSSPKSLEHVAWDSTGQQFLVKTKNNTKEN